MINQLERVKKLLLLQYTQINLNNLSVFGYIDDDGESQIDSLLSLK